MPVRFTILFLFLYSISFSQGKNYMLVGTYTAGKSEGIYVYDFNIDNGTATLVSSEKSSNPSYLAVAPDQKTIYAVNENAFVTQYGTGGSVSAFSFDNKKGELTPINDQFSGGQNPCYVAVDKTGKWLFCANYSSGNFGMFPLQPGGAIDSVKQVVQDSGTGPDKDRQEGPHLHSTFVSPDNKYLYTPDLGIDKVMIYRFDAATGSLSPAPKPYVAQVAGSGPRHMDFAPNNQYAYLMQEISGKVVAYKYKKGKLKAIQTIDALPAGFSGQRGSADIHVSPDGKFLYCSNRGESNTITIFTIDDHNGKLTVAGHQSTLGKTPRNFNFDPSGNYLLVANQNSDDIFIFKINHTTGLLTDTGNKISVPSPVCIKWIK